ncbi:putative SEC-C motif domain protein [Legionella lansingensis]|uniref:Putative SEC-C motif domain protein n=1 Tax=Legionella lansingensis TaxID=45067 RepID=A0A0W0VU55_9GAMM|nr:YchJ family protein [Legionella lansingensis]KTD23583.1 putative SEC-C motif domain protein [Legionella lansingensis]SNV52342.1 putative SEC-C motif domain protein [Legionella lansingensis]
MNLCPCGSQRDYQTCCEPYVTNRALPTTPEALMRSRYTAYTQANIDYIKKTMRGQALTGFNPIEATTWAAQVTWISLRVLHAYLDKMIPDKGYVEFIATFKDDNKITQIHELSEFEYHEGAWFYTTGHQPKNQDGKTKTKIARNAPCSCGSGKKFKNCCLR